MNNLRLIRKEKGLSMRELGKIIGVSESTISQYETGKREPDFETLLKLGEYFNVSMDYLLDRVEKSSPFPALTSRDEKDIARDLERIMSNLDSEDALAFHGEPLSDEDKELLRISLENSMKLAKQLAKQKFTPKKYRK